MNVEFHYYSTAFLAVKAGFSLEDATVLAYAGQYVDHHNRTLEIQTDAGTVVARPTQNYSFWDPETVDDVLAPFHFLPAGGTASVRADGAVSPWDVRPNSEPAKRLLVEALRTKNLYRVGLALHTFSDTWAHQNFTARNEDWNRLAARNRLPSPGHAHAGTAPDLWLAEWEDARLENPRVNNKRRFAECAAKVYRYLCTYRGKDFRQDEAAVAAELGSLIEAGRGRDSVDDRMTEFTLALDLEPYEKTSWLDEALESPSQASTTMERWKVLGEELLGKAGMGPPRRLRAYSGFENSHLGQWLRAADEHRRLAKSLVREATV
jgi:hypothetical protein